MDKETTPALPHDEPSNGLPSPLAKGKGIDKGKQRAHNYDYSSTTLPTEHTPLLMSSAPSSTLTDDPDDPRPHPYSPTSTRIYLTRKLTKIFFGSLLLTVLLILLLAFLAWSYASRVSSLRPEDVLDPEKGVLVFGGLDDVDVVSVTNNMEENTIEMYLVVDGSLGLDAGMALGITDTPSSSDSVSGLFHDIWKTIGRWGVRNVGSITIEMGSISVHPGRLSDLGSLNQDPLLLKAYIPSLEIPLSVESHTQGDDSWLTHFSTPVKVHLPSLTSNSSVMLKFIRDSWIHGTVSVRVDVEWARVTGGSLRSSDPTYLSYVAAGGLQDWRHRLIHKAFNNVTASFRFNLPQIPGLPTPTHPEPGKRTPSFPFPPLSKMVKLKSFSIISNEDNEEDIGFMGISASAELAIPIPVALNDTLKKFKLAVPTLPFFVSVPGIMPENDDEGELKPKPNSPIHIAQVSTDPFLLSFNSTANSNISLSTILSISGSVLPIPPTAMSILSAMLSRYLSSKTNSLLVSTPLLGGLSEDSNNRDEEGDEDLHFPTYIEVEFPAPSPRPRVLRDVTIRDMKIRPRVALTDHNNLSGSSFLASGIVQAHLVLPRGVNVGLDVFKVLPDVLIYDGEVPLPHSEVDRSYAYLSLPWRWPWKPNSRPPSSPPPPPNPLPQPLPDHAFGYIRPEDWLASVSEPMEYPDDDENEGGGNGNGTGTRKAYSILARVVDVPLEVLPGRQKEFSNFVGKVIFGSDGATAGLSGYAAVDVAVDGLQLHDPGSDFDFGFGGCCDEITETRVEVKNQAAMQQALELKHAEVVLQGLPFQGSVHVRKKGL